MHTLAYYLHSLNPYVFKIGPIGPRYYGLAYLTGFLFAYLLLRKLSRDGMLRLHPDRVADLVLNACIFGVLIGGRLGFVLFYDLPIRLSEHRVPLLWDFSSQVPFWGVLRVWDGGMSAHGGIIFTILALMVFAWQRAQPAPPKIKIWTLVAGTFIFGAAGFFSAWAMSSDGSVQVACAMALAVAWLAFYGWRNRIPVTNIGDASCMVVPIGLFFGRIANFINGELYGHPSSVPWAVKFPSELYAPTNGVPTIPDQSFANMQDTIATFISAHPDALTKQQVQDFLLRHANFTTGLQGQFGTLNLDNVKLLDNVRQSIAAYVQIPGTIETSDIAAWWQGTHNALWNVLAEWFNKILPARHPSQLYEAVLEGALLFIICWTVGRLWKKDGMASGAFLTFYPVMRIIGEQFRVGDTPITIAGTQISKGVLYSLPMFFAGLTYWLYFIRRSKRNEWVRLATTPASTQPENAAG